MRDDEKFIILFFSSFFFFLLHEKHEENFATPSHSHTGFCLELFTFFQSSFNFLKLFFFVENKLHHWISILFSQKCIISHFTQVCCHYKELKALNKENERERSWCWLIVVHSTALITSYESSPAKKYRFLYRKKLNFNVRS
jgi:4-amino-4-deoxy-L-arabinose transferase-like glycosyltransferase